MAKPWFSSSGVRLLRGLGLGGLMLLAASCLDLGVAVEFRTATTGQVRVEALAHRLAQGLQVLPGTDRVAFPATRAEWQALVDQVPGAVLVSWTGSDEDGGAKSQTVIGFTSPRALEGLFAVFKQKLTLLQDTQGVWTLVFVPQVPRVTGGDAEARKLWTALWGPTVWTFSFTPPGRPPGVRSVTLADLAGERPPAEWRLTW